MYRFNSEISPSTDVIYNLSSISGLQDIHSRGIGKDLVCHLIGNAIAYKEGTRGSINPLDYVTYSGNLFEIMAINGLMEFVEAFDEDLYETTQSLTIALRDFTQEMMLAAETNQLSSYYSGCDKDRQRVIVLVDALYEHLDESMQQRSEEISRHELRTNSPQVRIKRMLKKRNQLEDEGKLDKPGEWD